LQGLDHAAQIFVGGSHACALRSDGTVACWGDNSIGQLGLGDGVQVPSATVPGQVPGLDHVAWLGGTGGATCAALESGKLMCWGGIQDFAIPENLGVISGPWFTGQSSSPVEFAWAQDVAEIERRNFSCVRHRDATVTCWPNWRLPFVFSTVTL
jgi:hypothetical protein